MVIEKLFSPEMPEYKDMLVAEMMVKMRKMDKSSLKTVYDFYSGSECTLETEEICKKATLFIVDLLPSIGTRHAVSLMRDLVSMYPTRIATALPILAFVKPPHPKMPEELKVFIVEFCKHFLALKLNTY